MSQPDRRISELQELARSEGFTLPMPAEMIIYFESQEKVVDLETGRVFDDVTVAATSIAQAVAYLLGHEVGAVAL